MIETGRERIEQLVKHPGESLAVELKTWVSPSEPAGQAKIVKGAIALRNRNGGYLVIGFDDKTLAQDRDGAPTDIRSVFHVDIIQALVAKYASEPFEIGVEFVEREGIEHPVIVIPAGVKTPVAAKADLKGNGDTYLIRADEVYFRTLNSGNVVSSAKIKWKDWRDLVEICLDNREADIGRFFRRHLAGADVTALLHELIATTGGNTLAQQSIHERLESVMAEGKACFETAIKKRDVKLPEHGSWEVALLIEGEFPQLELQEFASLLSANNPNYTGWPVWFSDQQFPDQESRHYVLNGAWETLPVNHINFMRQDPRGRFYSYRALKDDTASAWSENTPTPMSSLDWSLPLFRVGEAIAVGQAFAKALQADEQAKLEFMFRWSGLRDRVLSSWVNRMISMRYITLTPRTTKQDTVTSMVTVPIDAPPSVFAEYVKTAVQPLYEVFEGFVLPGSIVDELIQKLLERRL